MKSSAYDRVMAELFGPHRSRPLRSNTFNALVKIYSCLPDHNAIAQFPSNAQKPENELQCSNSTQNDPERLRSDDVGGDMASRNVKQACYELVGHGIVEFQNLAIHNETSNDVTARVLCKDDTSNGSEMLIDKSVGTNKAEAVDSMGPDDKETRDGIAEVHNVPKDLLGIERILMDDSDDLDLLQLPDKDVNFDLFNDFGSFPETDVFGNNSVPIDNRESCKRPLEGNMEEDVVGEKKTIDIEFEISTSGGSVTKSHGRESAGREISSCIEVPNQFVNACLEDIGRKEKKWGKEKVPRELSEMGGSIVTAQKTKDKVATLAIHKFVDGTEKGQKSGIAVKGKTKIDKKAALKDVKSGKRRHISLDSEVSNSKKSEGDDSVVHGKMLELKEIRNKGNLSAGKVGRHWPENRDKIKYIREKLLHLRQVDALPENILKAVEQIGVELHGKYQSCAAQETDDASGSNKGQLGPPKEQKIAEEKVAGILKQKKRGSSSEAKKEKKKRQRRKKRAEMNKKLGVKRLKLKPVLKPKVVPHCRHYLKGRCQEGEKCKFSHDVVPLTKSKPCCHFARQSCMKGDDCPFDHHLSKYPCNNYVDTGFCNRGDSCLFSHKIPAEEGSEAIVGVSKCETNSLDQLDKSNSKEKLNANVSSSSSIATPKNVKEDLAVKMSQPAVAPKGLSFLSFGTPLLDDSSKHKEAASPLRSGDSAGTSGQQNSSIPSRAVNLGQTSMDISAPETPQGIGSISFERTSVASSGDKKQASHKDSSGFLSCEKSLLDGFAKQKQVRGICVPSSGGPSYFDSGDKLRANLRTDSSGQCSSRVDVPVKSTPNTAQRALLSTLAFAAKYESGIKMSSAAATTEVSMNEGTSSGSERGQNEMKASAILKFLYGGDDKEKQ